MRSITKCQLYLYVLLFVLIFITTLNAAMPSISLVTPTSNTSFAQNLFSEFTVLVSCADGDCGDILVSLDPTYLADQWASGATGNNTYGGAWNYDGMIGAPDVFACGDIVGAWASSGGLEDHAQLNLTYDVSVYATNISIHETFNTGFITKVEFQADDDTIYTVWEDTDATGCPGWLNLSFEPTAKKGKKVILYTNGATGYYEEIDAIQLTGYVDKGLVSDVSGTIPFWVNTLNPVTISLNSGESQSVTWWVNMTGPYNRTYPFFAEANLTSDLSNSDATGVVNITIYDGISPVVSSLTSIAGDTSAPYYDIADDSATAIIVELNENGRCRMSSTDESYDDMSDNTDCTGDGTTTITCTENIPESNNVQRYISCVDTNENENSADNNYAVSLFSVDFTSPSASGFDPASSSTITDFTPTITFTLDETGDCRASTSDETYDGMSDNDDCTGDGTTSISCTLSDLGIDGSKEVYIACQDTGGNKNTADNNNDLTYDLQVPPIVSSVTSIAGDTSAPYYDIVDNSATAIIIEIDEISSCRMSSTDESYDDMSDNTDCTGDGTTTITCTENIPESNNVQRYISCVDANENENSADNNYAVPLFSLDFTIAYLINFVDPTPINNINTTNTSIIFNVSITNALDFNQFIWNWNGTNSTHYNDSLVLMMNFDNVTALGEGDPDATGKIVTNTGVIVNSSLKKLGAGSYQFDGTSSRLSIPYSTDWEFGTGNFTIDFWWRTSTPVQTSVIYSRYDDPNNRMFLFFPGTGTNLQFYAMQGGSPIADYVCPFTPVADTWYHIAIVRSGSSFYMFINGVSQVVTVNTDLGSGSMPTYSSTLEIGRHHIEGYYVTGNADEFRVSKGISRWTESFTPPTEEYSVDEYTKLLLRAHPVIDASKYGNNGTAYGATSISSGKYNGAYSFDGTDDYITAPASSNWAFGTGDFAVSFWVYSNTNDDRRPFISNRRNDVGTENEWVIEVYDQANKVEFHSGATILLESTIDLTSSAWNHVVVTRNAGTLQFYINNVPSGSVANSNDFSETNALQIGRDILPASDLDGQLFDGKLDELRIYKHSLSTSEVSELYNSNLNKYDTDKWLFYSNESNLSAGTYTYQAFAIETAGNQNQTEERTINVAWALQDTPILNSTFGTNLASENLTVYNQSTVGASKNIINWYVDSIPVQYLNMPFEGGSNSTNTKDYSDYGNTGNVSGAIYNTTGGYDGKGAYQFDGVDDSIQLPNIPLTYEATFVLWAKPASDWPEYAVMIDLSNDSAVSYRVQRYGGLDRLEFYDGSIPIDGGVINVDEWNHIAVVVDHGTVTGYINGAQVFSDVTSNPLTTISGPTYLGYYPTTSFKGTLDEVQIFNRSLSSEEIQALYQNRTDRMVSNEMHVGDTWQACITPNIGVHDGEMKCSNSVTIQVPASASSPPSSSSSPKSFSLSKTFNCKTGTLNLMADGISGVSVSVIETSPLYQLLGTKSTASKGAEFTIKESGTYKVTAIKSGYNFEQLSNFDLVLCTGENPVEPPVKTPECVLDSDCSDSEVCIADSCAAVTGECGYVSNHAWVSYECCADADCSNEHVCIDHMCNSVAFDSEEHQALAAFEDAYNQIVAAIFEGKDTSAAELSLAEAQKLFEQGAYSEAKLKAEQALTLIREKPKANNAHIDTTQISQDKVQEQEKTDLSGLLLILGAGIVLIVILVGSYFLVNIRNRK